MSAARYELGLVGHSAGWPMMSRPTAAASTTTSREVTSRGLRRGLELGQPASLALRAIPTLQAASRDPEIPQRGKRLDYEARAIAAGGGAAEATEARLPGWCADPRGLGGDRRLIERPGLGDDQCEVLGYIK